MFPTLFVIFALALLYWFPVRRWMARWGTTPSDLTRVMAGDSLIVDPTYSGTMAVVKARPAHAKGVFVENVTLSATMLPGLKVDASSFIKI